ncbi:MAG TPA: peptidoglycan editing factor PgeF [Nocardioidaceae bacterium]|nr:peptidoglycan editing factor PgeF [Nocardioidaceae bacterium]
MFAFRDTQTEAAHTVDVAFTDRHGGFSGGPFASLNLSASPGDDPESVERNIERVSRAFAGLADESPEPTVVRMRQVQGSAVYVVDDRSLTAAEPPVADALVTRLPGVVLLVRVADCVPVLLADLHAGVVGAVHAGRPGLVAGVVPRAMEAMQAQGAESVRAWVGPHVCGACYEVPAEMRAEVSAVAPAAFAETSWGTPSLDVGAGVVAQLKEAGVDVVDRSRCTIEDEDLFSYRRQGRASGRLAGLIRLRP